MLDYFIKKATLKHGDKYDYSKVDYKLNNVDVIIICPKHGEFLQKPIVHYRSGCPCCGKESNTGNLSDFIVKANKFHDDKYDYTMSQYKNNTTKLTIICPIHGEFQQTPSAHLQWGCKQCGIESCKVNVDKLKAELELKYPQFGFDNMNYKDSQSVINITCPKHGDFKRKHRTPIQCSGCIEEQRIQSQSIDFKTKASIIHNDFYNYDRSIYNLYKDNVEIECPTHGIFKQTIHNHLQGKGCNKCAQVRTISKPQQIIIDLLESLLPDKDIQTNILLPDNKHIDIFIPHLNLGFEINGIYWHSENGGNPKNKNYHNNKSLLAETQGINLIHILDLEIHQKYNRIESFIKSKLGIYSNRVFGRKCIIREVDNPTYKHFCGDNHLQGYGVASVRLGLYYNNELISIMSFSKSRFTKHDWEMVRYCCKLNTTIIGGSKKLFKHFSTKYEGSIVSYSDNRFFDGIMYQELGFSLSHRSKPNYHYFLGYNIGTKLESRNKYQKHKLKNMLEFFDPLKTEVQNMIDHGYDRIWDCGCKVWVR